MRKKVQKTRKRPNGDGSVFQLPDGSWRAVVSCGSVGGKRIRKTRKAPTRDAAKQALADLQREISGALPAPSEITVADWLAEWIESQRAASAAEATLASYQFSTKNHLIPTLGGCKLSQLTTAHIDGRRSRHRTPPSAIGGLPRGLLASASRSPRFRSAVKRLFTHSFAILSRALPLFPTAARRSKNTARIHPRKTRHDNERQVATRTFRVRQMAEEKFGAAGVMSKRQAASRLNASIRTVERRIREGRLWAKKDGFRVLVDAFSVEKYLANLPAATDY